MDTNRPRTVLDLTRYSKFARVALWGIGIVCLGLIFGALLTSCSALNSAVSTAKNAVAMMVDGSANPLADLTSGVAAVVKADPAAAPYVQSVANLIHAHATDTAPSPAAISFGAGLIAQAPDVPASVSSITSLVANWYSAHHATLAAADGKAGPLIEQLAAAVEAGAGPVTGLKVISNPAN